MQQIQIKPVEIIGTCPAGLILEDQFQIIGMNLEHLKQNKLCFIALSQIPIMVWQLQSENRFFSHASCPGCITDMEQENRVVFLLGHTDKWDLCQRISEYLRTSKKLGEPVAARRIKEEAIALQYQGKYSAASDKMKSALQALRDEEGN